MHQRVLAEVSEEMNSKAPIIAKQRKESEFLKQKAGQYQKLVSAMKVCCVHVYRQILNTDRLQL